MRWLAVAVPLAVSCGGPQYLAWSDAVTGPDGNRAWAISCYREPARCYRMAGKQCPDGYDTIDTMGGIASSSEYRAVGQYASGSSRTGTISTMLIRCKAAQ